ncbi:MAG: methylmalonyl-CoA mutase family protein, partial [Metallosphaera sp.]
GVNMSYEPDWIGTTEVFRVNPEIRERVLTRLKKYKSERDQMKVRDSLNALRKAAENSSVNLFPYVLDAIKKGCTVGEISSALREIWGEYKEPIIF